MRQIFSLCFSGMTQETSRNSTQIFERNFVERSQGQRTKFAHFALITFAQYCNNNNNNLIIIITIIIIIIITGCRNQLSQEPEL